MEEGLPITSSSDATVSRTTPRGLVLRFQRRGPLAFKWKDKPLRTPAPAVKKNSLHPRFAHVRSRVLLSRLGQRVRRRLTSKRFWALSMLAHVGLLAAFSLFALDQFSRLAEAKPVVTVTDLWQIQTDFLPPPPPVPESKETLPELLKSDIQAENEDFQATKEPTVEDAPKTEPATLADDASPANNSQSTELLPEKAHADIGHVSDPEWSHFRPRNTRPGPSAPGPAAVLGGPGAGAGPPTASSGDVASGTGSGTGASVAAAGTGNSPNPGVQRGAAPINMDGGAYPRQAQKEAREGTVQLRVEVLETGRVGHVELYRSSGHTDLDETALSAARRWRFRPATRDGMAVATWVIVPVRYQLSDAH